MNSGAAAHQRQCGCPSGPKIVALIFSRPEKGQAVVGSARCNFKNVRAYDTPHNERILLEAYFEIGAGCVVGENRSARTLLKASGKEEDTIVKALFDPGIMPFHKGGGSGLVGGEFKCNDEHTGALQEFWMETDSG